MKRIVVLVYMLLFAISLIPNRVAGQQLFPQADPQDLGLVVPEGEPKPGGDRRVVVSTADGPPVVGQVYLEIGHQFLVLLPNGRIMSVAKNEATATDRPFDPATAKQLADELTKDKFRGFKTRSTKHYVYVFNTSKDFYQATSRVLETMYPKLFAYCKRQKLSVHSPPFPMIVIMFHTEEEFNKYRKMPPGVMAYYNDVNNYIVMYENSELTEIAPSIAVKQAISTIAHEGVHQILHNIGVQKRLSLWPMWISEGLPEYFAPTETRGRVRWAGVGKVNQLRLHALVKQGSAQSITGDGNWIRQTITDRELDANGYAAAWAITDFLAKRRQKQFFAYLREISQREPLASLTNTSVLFEKHFGEDYAGLEASVLKHLQSLPYIDPIANQPHFVAVLNTRTRRYIMLSSSPATIRQWQVSTLGKLPVPSRASAQLNVLSFPNKALAEQAYVSALGK